MKNIQIIDSALNCSYSIYSVTDEVFWEIFPETGQNVEFIEDVIERVGERRASEIVQATYTSRIQKNEVQGIHGTVFFGMIDRKPFYLKKRDGG